MSDNSYVNAQSQLLFEKRNSVQLSYGAATPASGKTASGTNGTTTLAVGNVTTFTDATALAFTPAMVGQTITISSGSHIVDDGVFLITGYTSASVISVYNPLAVVDSVLHWAVLPSPTIVAGDINQAYLSVVRAGVGVTAITTVDPFFEFVEVQASVRPSTSLGNWHLEVGTPVQNIGGFHPYIAGLAVTPNSWTIAVKAWENSGGTFTATDLIPTATTGTGGAPVTTVSGAGYATFVDVAGSFVVSMVGAQITVSGDATNPGNNGTFTILAFVNVNQIVISNPAAVTTTGLTWSVLTPALVNLEVVMNNSGPYNGSPQ